KALLDNALWDAYAQKEEKPLWALWGGRDSVELSWTVTRQAPLEMAREAAAYVGRHGFRTLKIKGGQGLDTDLTAMREVRAAVGEHIRLYVDANGAYAMADAAAYVARMAEAGCVVVEDPARLVPGQDFQTLQQQSPVPILVDFDLTSSHDLELFLERGAKGVSLKPGRFGLSFTRWMAQKAQAAGALAGIGLFGESSLGTLNALQLASTLPASALPAEVTWYLSMAQQLLAEPLVIREGRMTLSAAVANARRIDRDRLTPLC
ncbi:MAG: mandelate racemase/muconate lactonizing enzyme family protein, partial [Pigmentiphaga sp.]